MGCCSWRDYVEGLLNKKEKIADESRQKLGERIHEKQHLMNEELVIAIKHLKNGKESREGYSLEEICEIQQPQCCCKMGLILHYIFFSNVFY